jgi:hypothetical protein
MNIVNNILPMITYSYSYASFYLFQSFLNNMMDKNMANNFTCFMHAFGYCTTSLFYFELGNFDSIWFFLKNFSTGYFIYDIGYIIKNRKMSLTDSIFIYHHMSTALLLRDDIHKKNIFKMLFFAEFSNLPSYIIYYLTKTKTKNQAFLKRMKILQFFMYSFIRIPVIGYYLFDVLKRKPKFSSLLSLPIYFLGVGWTFKLYKGLT